MFGSATKEHIGSRPVDPSVVGDSLQVRLNYGTIFVSITVMRSQRGGRGIGDVRGRDNAYTTVPKILKELSDCLYFGIVTGVFGTVSIGTQCIDGALMASVQSGG